jgi:hypothetical protein
MHERERETIMLIMGGGRIGQVWVGMLVFHVGASLLLAASCGFHIGLLLEACLWTEHSRTMDYGWAWASYTHAWHGKAAPWKCEERTTSSSSVK